MAVVDSWGVSGVDISGGTGIDVGVGVEVMIDGAVCSGVEVGGVGIHIEVAGDGGVGVWVWGADVYRRSVKDGDGMAVDSWCLCWG